MSRSKRLPRVVIDTNLVLSSLVFSQGRLMPLREAWQNEECLPLVSKITAQELMRVLAYPKFKLTPNEQHELLADYLPYCSTIVIPNSLSHIPKCRDPHDLPFLQLAVAGKADYLVSGDADLLSIAGQIKTSIMNADEFLKKLNK